MACVRQGRAKQFILVRLCASFIGRMGGPCRAACALFLLALLLPARPVNAEQLPIRRYTTADGLSSNAVNCVKRDSKGFLWFCTAEGLSRFDGYSFINYGVDQGLPDRFVTDFLETRNGEYWVGTLRGLALLNPKPEKDRPLFTVYRPDETATAQRVEAVFQDRENKIYVATDGGLFQMFESAGKRSFQRLNLAPAEERVTNFLGQDHEGNLWIVLNGYFNAVICWRTPEGRIETLADPFFNENRATSLFVDREDRIWLGTYRGLALLLPHPGLKREVLVFQGKDKFSDDTVGSMFQSSDGKLWLGWHGLLEVIDSGRDLKFKVHGRDGFSSINAEDSNGNLWMGATRMAPHGFVTYGQSDGLATDDIRSVFEGQDGQLYIVTGIHSRYINRFDGKRFVAVAPMVPGHDASWDWTGWGWGQVHFQDHLGEWWIGTGYGLMRYPRVPRLEDLARTPPLSIYTTRDGLGGYDIFRLYEDSRGDIWISAWGAASVTRWERATGRFHAFSAAEGLPPGIPMSYRDDHSGNVWMGLRDHGLIRYRRGHIETFGSVEGLPDGSVLSLWLDHASRMWAGTNRGGLVRIDQPDADRPQFRVYSTKDGLSSNDVRAITEDHWGRIYFWTGRGVDRLEPETGGIIHYTSADGLVPAGSDNQVAFCDRHGNLWFGFIGLSRLDPLPAQGDPPALPIFIKRIRVRGAPLPISDLGETHVSGLVLRPSQNNMQIEFGGLNFGVGEVLRYQYKLEGAGEDWSTPSDLRAVNYAELHPGSYRFLVRVISGRGETSAAPATVSFQVLAPVWQRWWFLGLLATLVALAVYAVHQYRINHLLELERVRTRIASDLHDDVGSGLTQIAILSEVAKQAQSRDDKGEQLSRIADLARQLVDGMGEIVWAMNPQRDQVADLVQRMRRFASDVFPARGIDFDFRAPELDEPLPLRSDVRRQVYLIFKEAVNNSVRHSRCTRATIALSADKGEMKLTVSDNGQGISESEGTEGNGARHGLTSMRQRAAELGGRLEIMSRRGAGTDIFLRVPLSRRGFRISAKTT